MKNFPEQITSDDILGKEAIDPDGEILGVVTRIHIDRLQKLILGITVDQGFMKPEIFIGMDYIKTFGIDAILISVVPLEKYIGLEVLDAQGKKIGTVAEVEGTNHRIKKIRIQKRKGVSYSQEWISENQIQEIADRVILKKS